MILFCLRFMIHDMIHGTKKRKKKCKKKKKIYEIFENRNLINEELLYAICFHQNIPEFMVFKL